MPRVGGGPPSWAVASAYCLLSGLGLAYQLHQEGRAADTLASLTALASRCA